MKNIRILQDAIQHVNSMCCSWCWKHLVVKIELPSTCHLPSTFIFQKKTTYQKERFGDFVSWLHLYKLSSPSVSVCCRPFPKFAPPFLVTVQLNCYSAYLDQADFQFCVLAF